ncbi:MAG: FAD-dependent oxidoreductase, partial [Planctomycetota bacterium JB042]
YAGRSSRPGRRMIRDLSESCPAALPGYDVCIVGSGPAGGTVARELSESGLSVCVLESGRRSVDRHGDALREVEWEGLRIKEYSRERVLGGASTTWAGLSSPLDPIDLADRPWLRRSGWPIPQDALEPYWAAACERYGFAPLPMFAPGGFDALREKGDLRPGFETLEEKVFLANAAPQDFGRRVVPTYESAAVDLYLDATVTALERDPGGGRVRAAAIRTRRGDERRIEAGRFVVATGGIENARLLLASGLGNERDQVGRCFMNHPKNFFGRLRLERPSRRAPYWFGCLNGGFAGYAGLRLTEERQAALGVLNSYVRLEPLFPWSDNVGVEAAVLLAKRSGAMLRGWKARRAGDVVELRDYAETGDDSDLQNARKGVREWAGLVGSIVANAVPVARYARARLFDRRGTPVTTVRLRNFMEMEPEPENRVVLGGGRDVYGQPRARVVHRPTALDRRSMVELHAAFRRECEENGLGRFEGDLARAEPWPIDEDASHHLGTTRMGEDPATSVVDPDLRVHELDNLFVSGGSVFPTSGCANPTFTIVALAIRLAEHLRGTG